MRCARRGRADDLLDAPGLVAAVRRSLMAERKALTMKRPSGSNADEWHLFLCEYLDNRATGSGDGLGFIAVQIADALDDYRTSWEIQMRIALVAASEQFARYADYHLAKEPPDREKAAANVEWAARCREAARAPDMVAGR